VTTAFLCVPIAWYQCNSEPVCSANASAARRLIASFVALFVTLGVFTVAADAASAAAADAD